MASRGRGRKGRLRGTGQAPPVFDQQAFAVAVGIAVAAIAQASVGGSQEVLVTSRGLKHIILRHSQGEETRWWQTIGLYRSRKCQRLCRLPLTQPGSG